MKLKNKTHVYFVEWTTFLLPNAISPFAIEISRLNAWQPTKTAEITAPQSDVLTWKWHVKTCVLARAIHFTFGGGGGINELAFNSKHLNLQKVKSLTPQSRFIYLIASRRQRLLYVFGMRVRCQTTNGEKKKFNITSAGTLALSCTLRKRFSIQCKYTCLRFAVKL